MVFDHDKRNRNPVLKKPRMEKETFKCQFCGMAYHVKYNLERHVRQRHSSDVG